MRKAHQNFRLVTTAASIVGKTAKSVLINCPKCKSTTSVIFEKRKLELEQALPDKLPPSVKPAPTPLFGPPGPGQDDKRSDDVEWPVPDLRQSHLLWKAKSAITIFIVGVGSKFLLNVLNRVKIFNKERMTNAIFNRPEGVPLFTVSNHESCLDDPTLIASFMTVRQLVNQRKMRWSLAAQDICYRKKLHAALFTCGKCAPVMRNGSLGVYQRAVDFAIERLNEGDWVHIFPEGRVNMEREHLYRLKWGIGRMLSECTRIPIVIPFWHIGMHNVLPNTPPYIPHMGNKVFINVGNPIDITDVLQSIRGKSAMQQRRDVTDFIQDKLVALREETLEIVKNMK